MLEFDDELSARTEATYQTPDIVEQRRVTRALLALQPGERVLDIGVGPGFLAAEMASEVGPEGRVCGVDVSEAMLALAGRRGAPVELAKSDALHLPYPDGAFDAAVTTQVYEYVHDVPAALAEVRRVLAPGGRLLILDTDWDSVVWHSTDRDRMQRVLEKWNDHLADPYLPRRLPGLLRDAGFELQTVTIHPILNRGADPNQFSKGVAPVIAEFVGDPEWVADLERLGEAYFYSLNRYIFIARTGSP